VRIRPRSLLLPAALLLLTPAPAWAHVKWFADFSFRDPPLGLGQVVTPLLLGMALLSMLVIGALVFVERRLEKVPAYQRLNDALAGQRGNALLVMRVGMGASLLLAWQADALLAPELRLWAGWIGWFEFLCAALLLFRRTTPLAGAGVLLLYALGVIRFGAFHLLDYALFAGIGVYLLASGARSERIRAAGLPALYAAIGFSLCWVALEKLVYPQWGIHLLRDHPQLSLGLDARFFLVGAAFVEFSLGYLLIINLLQRPLALLITVVFFTTTLVFGKLEVIGHTPIHAALIVFLIEGPGTLYRAPITFHRRLALRTAFAAVNFAVLLALLLVPYTLAAEAQHQAALRAAPVLVHPRPGPLAAPAP
jgi:hypothetical protein